MTHRKIVVADTETASIKGGIVDLAVIEIDENLDIIRQTESLIDPQIPIVPAAEAIHGISQSMVADAPTAAEFIEHFGNPFAGADELVLIGHNIAFDYRALAAAGFMPENVVKCCTLRMSKNLWPDLDEDVANHKLGTLAVMFGLEKGTAHRAMGDTVTCLNLLRHIAKESGVGSFDELLGLGRRVLSGETKISFGKHRGTKLKDLDSGYKRWLLNQSDMDPDLIAALKAL